MRAQYPQMEKQSLNKSALVGQTTTIIFPSEQTVHQCSKKSYRTTSQAINDLITKGNSQNCHLSSAASSLKKHQKNVSHPSSIKYKLSQNSGYCWGWYVFQCVHCESIIVLRNVSNSDREDTWLCKVQFVENTHIHRTGQASRGGQNDSAGGEFDNSLITNQQKLCGVKISDSYLAQKNAFKEEKITDFFKLKRLNQVKRILRKHLLLLSLRDFLSEFQVNNCHYESQSVKKLSSSEEPKPEAESKPPSISTIKSNQNKLPYFLPSITGKQYIECLFKGVIESKLPKAFERKWKLVLVQLWLDISNENKQKQRVLEQRYSGQYLTQLRYLVEYTLPNQVNGKLKQKLQLIYSQKYIELISVIWSVLSESKNNKLFVKRVSSLQSKQHQSEIQLLQGKSSELKRLIDCLDQLKSVFFEDCRKRQSKTDQYQTQRLGQSIYPIQQSFLIQNLSSTDLSMLNEKVQAVKEDFLGENIKRKKIQPYKTSIIRKINCQFGINEAAIVQRKIKESVPKHVSKQFHQKAQFVDEKLVIISSDQDEQDQSSINQGSFMQKSRQKEKETIAQFINSRSIQVLSEQIGLVYQDQENYDKGHSINQEGLPTSMRRISSKLMEIERKQEIGNQDILHQQLQQREKSQRSGKGKQLHLIQKEIYHNQKKGGQQNQTEEVKHDSINNSQKKLQSAIGCRHDQQTYFIKYQYKGRYDQQVEDKYKELFSRLNRVQSLQQGMQENVATVPQSEQKQPNHQAHSYQEQQEREKNINQVLDLDLSDRNESNQGRD